MADLRNFTPFSLEKSAALLLAVLFDLIGDLFVTKCLLCSTNDLYSILPMRLRFWFLVSAILVVEAGAAMVELVGGI